MNMSVMQISHLAFKVCEKQRRGVPGSSAPVLELLQERLNDMIIQVFLLFMTNRNSRPHRETSLKRVVSVGPECALLSGRVPGFGSHGAVGT